MLSIVKLVRDRFFVDGVALVGRCDDITKESHRVHELEVEAKNARHHLTTDATNVLHDMVVNMLDITKADNTHTVNRIPAIKLYRIITNCGLKEAKDMIEEQFIELGLYWYRPHDDDIPF